jgi:hypothetical protein
MKLYIHTVFEPSAKKHLPFFSCFVKKKIHDSQKGIPSFVMRLMKLYFSKLTSCLSTLSFLRSILRRSTSYSIHVIDAIWCMMWCYAKWCDDMMQNDEDAEDTHPHAHTETHKLCIPLGTTLEPSSPFIFRCSLFIFRSKFCIPLGTSFELLHLLFRRYKFCIPLVTNLNFFALYFSGIWLCIENLRCAPLGMTFYSFGNFSSAFP